MPQGAESIHEVITIQGDVVDEEGRRQVEELDLWRRDPLECIRELIGNPAYHGKISYAPEKVYRDKEGNIRVYDETWTGD